MRAPSLSRLGALLLAGLLASCSFVVETDDLSGGSPRDAGTTDTDSSTCDPDACFPDVIVRKLADLAPCTRETVDAIGCRKAVRAACIAADPCCFKAGVGPVDFPNTEEATISCLIASTYEAPISEIVVSATACNAATQLGTRACDGAVHQSAIKRGHESGYLQSVDGDRATIVGLGFDDVEIQEMVTFDDLATHDPLCTPANVAKQACTTAVHRYCAASDMGTTSGFGPVATTATTATVVCLY